MGNVYETPVVVVGVVIVGCRVVVVVIVDCRVVVVVIVDCRVGVVIVVVVVISLVVVVIVVVIGCRVGIVVVVAVLTVAVVPTVVVTSGTSSGLSALNINTVPATKTNAAAATPANCANGNFTRLIPGLFSFSFTHCSYSVIVSSFIIPIALNKSLPFM